MSMKQTLEQAARIVEELTRLRTAKAAFVDGHRKIFAELESLEQAEKKLMIHLVELAGGAKFPDGVNLIPICCDFSFTRRANPLYARPGIFKWWKQMLEAGIIKPPSVSGVEKLLRKGKDAGGLPSTARRFLPGEDGKTYKSGVGKPKGW